MIKANEIRIDNLLFYDTGESIENNFVDWEDIKMCYVDNEYFNEHYSPIPLTEDWLVRFGLVKRNGYPHELMDGYIKIRNGVYFFKYYKLEVELPFVHTLQNFYFSTKGKELELKPEP